MEKPMSLVVKETKEEIVNIINEKKLPAFILEPIVKEVYEAVLQAKEVEYQNDLKKFESEQ